MKIIILTSLLCIPAGISQNATESPEHRCRAEPHGSAVDMRSDHAMGFSHEMTTHHFSLLSDGGVIAVDTNAENDDASRDQIRMHLAHIAASFSANDFDLPMFIHDRVPPGVPTMKQKQQVITYTFQPTMHGGQVWIRTQDSVAIEAVHEFLRFQIKDHRTGDTGQVKPMPK